MAGFYEGSDLANKTFYGFRLDNATGNLSIDILTGDVPVSIPTQTLITGPNDYKAWVWSTSTYQFQWGAEGHLNMVFV